MICRFINCRRFTLLCRLLRIWKAIMSAPFKIRRCPTFCHSSENGPPRPNLINCNVVDCLAPVASMALLCQASGSWRMQRQFLKRVTKNSVTNYRPISLLCLMSKVRERCFYNQIIESFRPMIHPCQYMVLWRESRVPHNRFKYTTILINHYR